MISMLNRKYQLFMPSIGAFCVEDPIPFHLQLSSVESSHPNIGSAKPPRVKVRIMRRITMNATDRMAERCIVLGEGTLQPLRVPTHGAHATLNWQGEAHCRDPGSIVGTFDCGPAVAVMVCVRFLSHSTCLTRTRRTCLWLIYCRRSVALFSTRPLDFLSS
jgi:hypothetical protein